MKKRFFLKRYRPKTNDLFFMEASSDFLTFFCVGYTDLLYTMRGLSPKGYRTRKAPWYNKWLRLCNNHLVLLHPLFKHPYWEIVEIHENIEVLNRVKVPIEYGAIVKGKVVMYDFQHEVKQVDNAEFERCLAIYS